jgi:BlaI family transcriptional regulator, penicillinase repressor
MSRPPQDVTDAEFAILQTIWTLGRTTIRKVADEIYPGGNLTQYATVQKLVERLERKHYILRDRSTWPHQFDTIVSREELMTRRLQSLADQLCEGNMSDLLICLIRSFRPTESDRHTLRQMLDDLDAQRASN